MYTITKDDKLKSLINQLRAREQEVFGYQLNVDNYEVALVIADDAEFQADMRARLVEERKQQAIAQLMLDVALKQLEGEDITALLEEHNATSED